METTVKPYKNSHELLKQSFNLYYAVIKKNTADNIEAKRELISRRLAENKSQGVTLEIDKLKELFDLSDMDLNVLIICLSPQLEIEASSIYNRYEIKYVNLNLAIYLLNELYNCKESLIKSLDENNPLFKWNILYRTDEVNTKNQLEKSVRVDQALVDFLLEKEEITGDLDEFLSLSGKSYEVDSLYLEAEEKKKLSGFVNHLQKEERNSLLFFHGLKGVGKRKTATALCNALGKTPLILDIAYMPSKLEEFKTEMKRVIREALLRETYLIIRNFDLLLNANRYKEKAFVISECSRHLKLSILNSTDDFLNEDISTKAYYASFKFNLPERERRKDIWERHLGDFNQYLSELSLSDLALMFKFTEGQIKESCASAKMKVALYEGIEKKHFDALLIESSREQSKHGLKELATKVESDYSWDDLHTYPFTKYALEEICVFYKRREAVFEKMEITKSSGKGVIVLFEGDSGTGKTMGASVLANRLKLELYKVNLSRIIDKYVGETEKNLDKVFEAARMSNAILLFDEADALFGKRSAVQNAQDRYANQEISYLLQRMEDYDGICILTTNLFQNIDQAFARRFHFSVRFAMWNRYHRKDYVEHLLEKTGMSFADDVNLEYFTYWVLLAHASYKSIIILATCFAQEDGSDVITMKHLVRAAMREKHKSFHFWVKDDMIGKFLDQDYYQCPYVYPKHWEM